MTNKTLFQLAIVLILGIALLVLQSLWGRYQNQKPNDYLKIVQSLPKDTIDKVTLTQNGKTIELLKENTEWKVGSKSADKEKVTAFVDALYPATSPVLTATSQEQLNNLNTTENKGIKVILSGKGKENGFLIGKQIGSATAVAPTNRLEVYQVTKLPAVSVDANDWVDLTVVDIDSENLKKLAYTAKSKTYTLAQNETNQWVFDGEQGNVNNDAVNNFVMKFNPLKAKELAYDKKVAQYNLKLPEFVWSLTDANGQETKLEFYKGKNDYLVKKGTEDYFVLAQTTGDDLNKSKDKFTAVK